MKKLVSLLVFIGLSILGIAQTTAPKTVKIGSQSWTSENFSGTTFNNGEAIPEAKTAEEWKAFAAAKKPAWCYYEFNAANKNLGKLYNRYVIEDKRGIVPAGFRLPTIEEWETLIERVGDNVAGLKATTTWASGNDATNALRFNALATGEVGYSAVSMDKGESASWWSTSVEDGQNWIVTLDNSSFAAVEGDPGSAYGIRFIK